MCVCRLFVAKSGYYGDCIDFVLAFYFLNQFSFYENKTFGKDLENWMKYKCFANLRANAALYIV